MTLDKISEHRRRACAGVRVWRVCSARVAACLWHMVRLKWPDPFAVLSLCFSVSHTFAATIAATL